MGDSWESEHGREAKVEAAAALALDAADVADVADAAVAAAVDVAAAVAAALAAAVDVAVGQDADAGEPPSQLSDSLTHCQTKISFKPCRSSAEASEMRCSMERMGREERVWQYGAWSLSRSGLLSHRLPDVVNSGRFWRSAMFRPSPWCQHRC